MNKNRKRILRCWLGALAIAFVAGCGGDETAPPGSTDPNNNSSNNNTNSSSQSWCCSINGQAYDCPGQTAFDKCTGEVNGSCFDQCDFEDHVCMDNCMASRSDPDPSDCTPRSTPCPSSSSSTPSPGICSGSWTGAMCDEDSDCKSWNCYQNKCYPKDDGNPCDEDSDCTSWNCHDNCCYSKDKGSPCDEDSDCTSWNCYNNRCQ